MGAIAGSWGQLLSGTEVKQVADSMTDRSPAGWEQQLLPEGFLMTGFKRGEVLEDRDRKLWSSGDEYLLCFTGRLDNGEELQRELCQLGHELNAPSQREILLHAYAQWQEQCAEKLQGAFSFALYSQRQQKLFLARDKLGGMPLFYRTEGAVFQFGSEIKTLLSFPGVRAELTKEGAAQLVLFSPGRIPGSGVLKGIQELEPGCCLSFCRGRCSLRRYWQLRDDEHRENLEQTAEHILFLLQDSLKRLTWDQRDYGTLLSGGLDSSILTALCALNMPGERLKTFSVDYRNNRENFVPGKYLPESDRDYIAEMTEAFSCRHYETELSPEDLTAMLRKATRARDLPGMGDVDFSLMAFAKQVSSRVPMVLSGECADEIFGGYPWFRDPAIDLSQGFPWSGNAGMRAKLLAHPLPDAQQMLKDACLDTCRSADIAPGCLPEDRRMKQLTVLNQRWFMQTLLERNDRMTGLWGLDVRVPFCDDRLFQYVYRIPWEMKNYGGREKGLLRLAVKGLLPERIRLRKKSPYPKTFDPEYCRSMEKLLHLRKGKENPLWYLLSQNGVEDLLSADSQTLFYGQLMQKPQIIAWILQIDYWLSHYRVEFCF